MFGREDWENSKEGGFEEKIKQEKCLGLSGGESHNQFVVESPHNTLTTCSLEGVFGCTIDLDIAYSVWELSIGL